MADLLRSRRAGSSRDGSILVPLECGCNIRDDGAAFDLTPVTSSFGDPERGRFRGGSGSSVTRLSSRLIISEDLGGDTDFLFWAVRSGLTSGAVLVMGGIVRPLVARVSLRTVSSNC